MPGAPTCCNYLQDSETQDALAQFLPEVCLSQNHPYKLLLNDFLCSQCRAQQPYIGVTNWPDDKDGNKQRGVNLYICESMAK